MCNLSQKVKKLELKLVNERCILPAIADIRRPWRWDMVLNYKISKILKESNNCGCVL